MIGKNALIKAIRIASGGGGTPPDPADLRLHWNIDDSDLAYGTVEYFDSMLVSGNLNHTEFYTDGMVVSGNMNHTEFYTDGMLLMGEFSGGSMV